MELELGTKTRLYHQSATLTLVLCLIAAATLPCRPAAASDDKRASVTISSSQIPPAVVEDFGTIPEGQAVVLDLLVKNDGASSLRIGAVRPMCGCMTEESERTIEPRGTGRVSLRLETVGYSGPATEAALIEWIDSPVAVTRAELKIDVQPVLEILPRRLVRFRVDQGSADTQELYIKSPRNETFTISRIEASAPFLDATLAADRGGYRLVVRLGPHAPAGLIRESITLHTDLATLAKLEIKVTGVVRARG